MKGNPLCGHGCIWLPVRDTAEVVQVITQSILCPRPTERRTQPSQHSGQVESVTIVIIIPLLHMRLRG